MNRTDYSDNSNRILFDALDTANVVQTWVVNPDGTGLTQLTNFTTNQGYTAIDANMSMDGNRIVYACRDLGGLCVMNADGSGSQKITQSPTYDTALYPRWSIDGSKIVFTNYNIAADGIFDLPRPLHFQTRRLESADISSLPGLR